MKLFKILSLTLLLHCPLSHAGCTGYEDFYDRSWNIGTLTSFAIVGGGLVVSGVKDLCRASNKITKLIQNDAPAQGLLNAGESGENLKDIQKNLGEAGMQISAGTIFLIASLGSMISNESGARSNCCNALPSNSTCNWKD